MFYDDNPSGNYANSQTRTITFCSGTSEHVMVDFFLFETQNNGLYGVNEVRTDILNVYDGNSTASPQIFSLSGGSDPNEGEAPIIISSGSCLTFQFTSNASTRDKGWEAMISCTDEQNNVASNYCATAPYICNLNGYQGSTTNFYNPESVSGQIGSAPSSFPGTLDNNSFIKFKPTSTTVSLQLNVFNCSGGITSTSGFYEAIQFAVYEQGSATSCDLGAWISDYYDVYDGVRPGNYTKVLSGLTIGATYYIVVDGLWGTVCDYTIDVNSGITLPEVDISNAIICSGTNITINASGGSSYLWSTGSTSSSITVSSTGIYEVIVTSGNPDCPNSTLLTSDVLVNVCNLPVELVEFYANCNDNFVKEIGWTTVSETNSDYFVIERSIDGYNWVEVGQVSAAGESSNTINYFFYDDYIENKPLLYRLTQHDFDGNFEIFEPISVNCLNDFNDISLYPNPSNNQIYLNIPKNLKIKNLEVTFYSIQGQLIFQKTFNEFKLKNAIDVSLLAEGCYTVHVSDNSTINKTIRFVKSK